MKDRTIEEDIFVVDLNEVFVNDFSSRMRYLVYSPLASKFLLADDEGLGEIDEGVLYKLRVVGDRSRFFGRLDSSSQLQKMAVLPNHTCNFNCSYCYSALGRSNTVLDKEKLDRGLEFFINPDRLENRNLSLSFIGGGEPLISWPLVQHGIEYATLLAQKGGFSLLITLVTNGSIMNDNIIATLKENNVLPDVSFDIIEEAQNRNRGHFDVVCSTIDKLCAKGVVPSVNATITPDTVERQEEMVRFMQQRFPEVKNMVFEPVVSKSLFPSVTDLSDFYSRFLEHFFKAKNTAVNSACNVTCRIYKNVELLLQRGCPSKLTLTPQGDISVCYCCSSPKERAYTSRVYGYVDQKAVHIDEVKFKTVNGINVHSNEKCSSCFAKWHCGGGCMCPNDTYDDAYLDEVCRFTRRMVARAILERMR